MLAEQFDLYFKLLSYTARQRKITQMKIYTQTFKINIVHSKNKFLMTCMSTENYINRGRGIRQLNKIPHFFFF